MLSKDGEISSSILTHGNCSTQCPCILENQLNSGANRWLLQSSFRYYCIAGIESRSLDIQT